MDGVNAGDSERRSGSVRGRTFVSRLYELVNDPAFDNISWNHDGSSFIVWRPQEFATDLLHGCLGLDNFTEFVARLNEHGFRRVVPDRWEFAKDCFKRGENIPTDSHESSSSTIFRLSTRYRETSFLNSRSTTPSCISISAVTQQIPATPELGEDPSDADLILRLSNCDRETSFQNYRSTTPSSISISAVAEQVPATPDLPLLRAPHKEDIAIVAENWMIHPKKRKTYKYTAIKPHLFLDVSTSTAQSCIQTPGTRNLEETFLEAFEGDTLSEASISKGTANYVGNSAFGGEYDSYTISESSKMPTSLALGNPAVITQDGDVAASDIQPIWDKHSDRMVVGDALLYGALFSPHHEFQKDKLIQLWMAARFVVQDPMEYFAALFFLTIVSPKATLSFPELIQPLKMHCTNLRKIVI